MWRIGYSANVVSLIEEAEQLIRNYEATYMPKMKLKEFEAIAKAITSASRRRAGLSMFAAKLVLMEGMRPTDACVSTGADKSALSRLLSNFGTYSVCLECKQALKVSVKKAK